MSAATTPWDLLSEPTIGAVMIQLRPTVPSSTGPKVSTLRLLAKVDPEGAGESLRPGSEEATAVPLRSKICMDSNDDWDADKAFRRALRPGFESSSTLVWATARSCALRSATQSLMRTAALSAVASARALAWSMLVWALQLDITNPRRMEIGIDTSSKPAMTRIE